MNKQQLAAKIWASANKMRSKIEANEYKDYILGFIFYKFLSDNEVRRLKEEAYWTDDEIRTELDEANVEEVKYCQNNFGYFIAYDNLFSTWLEKGIDFSVSDVTDALAAFSRLISPEKNKHRLFKGIFHTLETGLDKLGGTPAERTKSIRKLLRLIKEIPTDDNQDYDVLGFIYEYLIEHFAANAGKKAGEFYTPHEVSLLMAEIVANHLKDREKIDIYDPTSGSGSLLINIGKAVSKYLDDSTKVRYYAQELKENTFNLTRMNLVMRGIDADNILVRCGDTLEDDWPFFEETEDGVIIENTYQKLPVDAVVSNPPYSQAWDPKGKEEDVRFKDYGLAPKGKADYAFLLHDLCHIKEDGIVTIVLPHGVLFRPGEDYAIRSSLIEANNIDAIIGLPGNIFFGTGISTLIMVLKRHRTSEDVLIIDASKLSVKDGKKNKLTASDIRRIADEVINRTGKDPKFSRLVSRDVIRGNDYNLNIPRYVDLMEALESWDAYATMFGGMPNTEIDLMRKYWETFPTLKQALFSPIEGTPCSNLLSDEVQELISANSDVTEWQDDIHQALKPLHGFLDERLIGNMMSLNINREESLLAQDIFGKIGEKPLIDRYDAYQVLDDQWNIIAGDLELLQTEGFETAKVVDPNMEIKKATKDDEEDQEIQKGWKGHILPFELVQQTLLNVDLQVLQRYRDELEQTQSSIAEWMEELSEEDKETYLNENGDAFDTGKVADGLSEALAGIETEELKVLGDYLAFLEEKPKKPGKLQFVDNHRQVDWTRIEASNDGTFSKKNVQRRINEIRFGYVFPEGSTEQMLVEVTTLFEREKSLKRTISECEEELHLKTKETIENLTDEQVLDLLRLKWIEPLCDKLNELPSGIVEDLSRKVSALAAKYKTGLTEVERQIVTASQELSKMLDGLTGSESDMQAFKEFEKLLTFKESEKLQNE